jgi:RNA-binding protein YhbY
VSPSATIINIKKIKNSNRIYVYVAAQNVKEKSLKEIEKKLGSTELIKAGVKNSSLAARINSMWI